MGLEAAQYVDDFIISNPAQTDLKREGDNHIRMIKEVLKRTFPGANRSFAFPTAVAVSGGYTITAAQSNAVFYCDTSAGYFHLYLPVLAAAQAGWSCQIVKVNVGLSPVLVSVQTGTLTSGEVSGLAWARRCIPGQATTAIWTGAAWYLTRVPGVPVASCLEFHGSNLPVGYEWPTGQVFSASFYPEYVTVMGTTGTWDRQERVAAMVDKVGVNRIHNVVNGDLIGSVGGADVHALTEAQLASHAHGATSSSSSSSSSSDSGHSHGLTNGDNVIRNVGIPSGIIYDGVIGSIDTLSVNTGYASISTSTSTSTSTTVHAAGSGHGHPNVQPTIMMNFILVVE